MLGSCGTCGTTHGSDHPLYVAGLESGGKGKRETHQGPALPFSSPRLNFRSAWVGGSCGAIKYRCFMLSCSQAAYVVYDAAYLRIDMATHRTSFGGVARIPWPIVPTIEKGTMKESIKLEVFMVVKKCGMRVSRPNNQTRVYITYMCKNFKKQPHIYVYGVYIYICSRVLFVLVVKTKTREKTSNDNHTCSPMEKRKKGGSLRLRTKNAPSAGPQKSLIAV